MWENTDALLGSDQLPHDETGMDAAAEMSSTEDLLARLRNRQNGAVNQGGPVADDSTVMPQAVNERVSDEARTHCNSVF